MAGRLSLWPMDCRSSTEDATLVSPVRGDGSARRQCADVDGAALRKAGREKETTYPDLARGAAERARFRESAG